MYNEHSNITFTAGEELVAYQLVKIKAGSTTTPPEVILTDSTDNSIGTTLPVTMGTASSGTVVGVRLRSTGIHIGIAAGTIAVGAPLYHAADGKISIVSTDAVAMNAVAYSNAAADEQIEFIYI